MIRPSKTTLIVTLIAAALVVAPITGGALAAPAGSQQGSHSDLRAAIDWNAIARHASIDVARQSPAESVAHLGLVQAAVYNAVVAITGSHAPFGRGATPRPDADLDAAIAAAAHGVLVSAFPDQRDELDTAYGEWLAEHISLERIEYDPSIQAGLGVGSEAAAIAIEMAATAGVGSLAGL